MAALVVAIGCAAFFAGSSAATTRDGCTEASCTIVLASPVNGQVIPYTSGMTITFGWATNWTCSGAGCVNRLIEVRITTDQTLQNVVQDKYAGACNPNCPQSWTSAPFTQPGTYYWQVSTKGDPNLNPVSQEWSFTLAAQSGGSSSGSRTYSDAAGDAKIGYDITDVTVSNDSEPNIHISVPMPAHPSQAPTERIVIFIDSDLNSSTGNGGADIALCDCGSSLSQMYLYTYNGSGWVSPSSQPASLRVSYNSGWSIDVLQGELGIGATLRFDVKTFQRTGDNTTDMTDDYAPDQGYWDYMIPTKPKPCTTCGGSGKPVLRQAYHTASGPIAGQNFAESLDIINSKTQAIYRGGSVSCRAYYGNILLTVFSSGFDKSSSLYRCWWRIPPDAVGKVFLAKVTVSFGTGSVSNPTYKATVRQSSGVLVFPNGVSRLTPLVAGQTFYVNLSARLRYADGSFQTIKWSAGGSSAQCSGHVMNGPSLATMLKKFATGIQCGWTIPSWARGKEISFAMTVRALGQSKTVRFTARAG